jgi:hypothetical protein
VKREIIAKGPSPTTAPLGCADFLNKKKRKLVIEKMRTKGTKCLAFRNPKNIH